MLRSITSELKGNPRTKEEAKRAERRYGDVLIALTNQAIVAIFHCCSFPSRLAAANDYPRTKKLAVLKELLERSFEDRPEDCGCM